MRKRLSLSFPAKAIEEYLYLKNTKNASTLVRYLTILFTEGYIPNPVGITFGK